MAEVTPRVGVAALIGNSEGKIVIGKRKGSHGASKHSLFFMSSLLSSPWLIGLSKGVFGCNLELFQSDVDPCFH